MALWWKLSLKIITVQEAKKSTVEEKPQNVIYKHKLSNTWGTSSLI